MTPHTPWYKHRWPWLLMAGPAAVIVAGAITIWLAVVSFDGLVDDDYYKQGLAVNQRIERDRAAVAQGITAEVMQGEDGRQFRVLLLAGLPAEAPAALVLRLTHPTRAGLDQQIDLTAEGGGLYRGTSAMAMSGRWLVTLADPGQHWRLTGDWSLDAGSPRTLRLGTSADAQ